MASAGVCISRAIGVCNATMTSVSANPTRAKSHTDVPMVRAACRSSLAPVAMAMRMVVPVVRPRMMPVTVCIT